MKVTGIGQCSFDNLFIVDTFPLPDTKKEILQFETAGGGPVATALVSLARLGVSCSFHGITGDDEEGEKIRRSLGDEKIDVSGLITRAEARSQIAFICIEKGSGRRTIFWKRPSGQPLRPEELPDDFLADVDFLLLDGLMHDVSIHAARKAKAEKVPVMLDAGRVREGMIELAELCDYIVCSEEFAREYAGSEKKFDPRDALLEMRGFGARAVTITLGERGSVTLCGDKVYQTPAFKVDVVDTTGAGDVFHGGYIYGLLQKWDIEDVVRFASAFAALKCRKPGGRAGIPSLQEVYVLLNERTASP
jgi:ribokinase